MSAVTKGLNTFILSLLILTLLVMIALGFMLGFTHPLPWILIGVLIVIPIIHDKIISRRFIKWQDSYNVGIDSIDKDHRKLLGMINQLQTASHYITDESLVEHILDDLIDYTKYHFSREEKLMMESEYPNFLAHQKLHKDMIAQVTKFIDEYRLHKTRTVDEVTQFLKAWLIHHINGSDKEYVPYFKKADIQ